MRVYDIYDDTDGSWILKSGASASVVGSITSNMDKLSSAELNGLPDYLFGLVADYGDNTLRKYAMHDPEHTATSIMYFMRLGSDQLPEDTRAKVATNLCMGCDWYDIVPPLELVKLSLIGGVLSAAGTALTAGSAMSEQGQTNKQKMDQFRQAQAGNLVPRGPTKVASGRIVDNTSGGGVVDKELKSWGRGPNNFKYPIEGKEQIQPWIEKKADLIGTEAMPVSNARGKRPLGTRPASQKSVGSMKLSWMHGGDLTGWEPPKRIKKASYSHFALPSEQRYPLDTVDHVKTAQRYFEDHWSEMPRDDRREYAESLRRRSEDLGVKLSSTKVMEYAGEGYGPHIDGELLRRARGCVGTEYEGVYDELCEKRASIEPIVMASMLEDLDAVVGSNESYNRPGMGLRDPYQAVYGKLASVEDSDTYRFSMGRDYVSGPEIENLATNGARLDKTFGDGFQETFRKDPVGVFKSLPDPQKVVLARMARDRVSAPAM